VLAAFGRSIGVAFQVFDDVLDVAGPVERTGKARGTDLLDGTVTLPLIVARERDAALAALDLRAQVTTPAEAERVCDAIAASGALEESRAFALEHVAAAKAAIKGLALPERQARLLDLVADGVVERYS
jgi:geranylgeranyl pyrophosphate synthase